MEGGQGILPMVEENKDPKISSLNFAQAPVASVQYYCRSFLHVPRQTFFVAQPKLLLRSSQLHYSTFLLSMSLAAEVSRKRENKNVSASRCLETHMSQNQN